MSLSESGLGDVDCDQVGVTVDGDAFDDPVEIFGGLTEQRGLPSVSAVPALFRFPLLLPAADALAGDPTGGKVPFGALERGGGGGPDFSPTPSLLSSSTHGSSGASRIRQI